MNDIKTVPNNPNYSAAYCLSRLPCGYCTMLNRPCPMIGMQAEPTWKTVITCTAGRADDAVF